VGTVVVVDELDALIEEAGKRGYLWYQFRVDRHGPEGMVGVYQWRDCADVVVLTDDADSHAYRTPADVTPDVFAPSHVCWWYGRSEKIGMVWVVRALLTLPHPDEPGGLPALMPAPPDTGVPGKPVPLTGHPTEIRRNNRAISADRPVHTRQSRLSREYRHASG
jgi:hypothetical protein